MINQRKQMFKKKNNAWELDFQPNAQSVIYALSKSMSEQAPRNLFG